MRILKTALLSLITTAVLLPLALVIVGALRAAKQQGEFLFYVDRRVLLEGSLILFIAVFAFTWFVLGKAARTRELRKPM